MTRTAVREGRRTDALAAIDGHAEALLAGALDAASKGWSVIPAAGITAEGTCDCWRGQRCHSPGKHPRHRNWQRWTQERADATQIRAWWARSPRANVAVVTGAISGLTVIDVDGDVGRESWRRSPWCPPSDAAHGLVAVTAAGFHVYYVAPGGPLPNRQGMLPGVDVRSENGIVIVPPSVHLSGRRYTWDAHGTRQPAPLSETLRRAIAR